MQQRDAVDVEYRRAPLWPSVAAFLFDQGRYLDMAWSHSMAVNLEAPDLANKFYAGTFPPPEFEQTVREEAREGRSELLRAIRDSLYAVGAVTALALIALWFAGRIDASLPVAWPKVLGGAGTFLIAWSALFELGEYWKSLEGIALHELVRPKLFALLFLPGVLLVTTGQLW